ncbi:protein PFF0380w-like [Vespula squamosa]|uniref:Protein PFF0380w-like n=1 Tax=Vespula squamosa TaxID=30214 RepID=A0ABD2BN08_VESSQ
MNIKEDNVISSLEGDAWASSNNLEGERMDSTVDVSDCFRKEHNFSIIRTDVSDNQIELVLLTETEKENECIIEISDSVVNCDNEISNDFNKAPNDLIWIMTDKETQDVNKKIPSLDSQVFKLAMLEADDTVSYLPYKCDSRNNRDSLKLQSDKNSFVLNNSCNTRSLPNILRGPKTFSKHNTSSISFETEDNSYNSNSILENNIFEEENIKNSTKSHHKRKQRHNPLIIQEEPINLVAETADNCDDNFIKKNKPNSRKAMKLNHSDKRKMNHKKKSFLFKKVNDKQPVKKTFQESNVTTDPITSWNNVLEQNKEKNNDLDLPIKFNAFYEEQFHEDYTDHFDILTDVIKEQQVFDDKCDNINSNNIHGSNVVDYPELQCQESLRYNFIDQVENSWEGKNVIFKDNSFSDCEDYFQHKNKNYLLFEKCSDTKHISSNECDLEKASIYTMHDKNYLSSYFNDSLDDAFCQNNLSYNCLQNSLNKDKVKSLDNLLFEEKKYESYLGSQLNNDLNSSNINFANVNKNTTHDILSNDLEHSTIISEKVNAQQNVQPDVLPDTELSAKFSSNSKSIALINSPENDIHLNKAVQEEEKEMHCNYMIVHKFDEEFKLKCNYEEANNKLFVMKESDTSVEENHNSNDIKKTKNVIEPLQCLLCPLKFSSKRSLTLHITGAHGDMYVILCERCGRLFNKKYIFNKHFIHCGCVKLPFTCKTCNRNYRHKSSLLHHLKIVHQMENKQNTTKAYKCDICSKIYRKYGAFEKHLGIHVTSQKSRNLRNRKYTFIVAD